jgi:predicted nucleotidyltransferase/DNA-binding HxlR family transcriptional regulator
MGTQEIATLLFGKYRRQLLALLLLRPDETFYVRELERLSGLRAGALHRELTALADAGIVRRARFGNQVRYKANPDNPIFEDLANILRKTTETGTHTGRRPLELKEPAPEYRAPKGREGLSGLKRLNVAKSVVSAICRKWNINRMSLFGSVTRDDFRPDSDVDVLVEFRRGEWPSLFGIVDLQEELCQVFGRPAHVVTPAIFRNPIRARSIQRDLECIYAAA